MTPLPAKAALDQFFLEARSRLLDVAAILDRLDRGTEPAGLATDGRVERLRKAVQELATAGPGRAERVQQIFSLPYDATWPKPSPR